MCNKILIMRLIKTLSIIFTLIIGIVLSTSLSSCASSKKHRYYPTKNKRKKKDCNCSEWSKVHESIYYLDNKKIKV